MSDKTSGVQKVTGTNTACTVFANATWLRWRSNTGRSWVRAFGCLGVRGRMGSRAVTNRCAGMTADECMG
jgi:hypothetical protein